MNKYYVVQRYYDNGKTEAEILTKAEAIEKGYYAGYKKETSSFDLFVDGCDLKDDADQIFMDTLNA